MSVSVVTKTLMYLYATFIFLSFRGFVTSIKT